MCARRGPTVGGGSLGPFPAFCMSGAVVRRLGGDCVGRGGVPIQVHVCGKGEEGCPGAVIGDAGAE
jgi:hypothetical protein